MIESLVRYPLDQTLDQEGFFTLTKTVAFRFGAGSGGSGRFTPGVLADPLDEVWVVLKSAARPVK